MWVRKWVRRDDPQLDPHGEMCGKVQRVPDRKFGLLLIILQGLCPHERPRLRLLYERRAAGATYFR